MNDEHKSLTKEECEEILDKLLRCRKCNIPLQPMGPMPWEEE